MNVYLTGEEGLEHIGQTSLVDEPGDECAVDVDLPGTGYALHLVYALKTLPYLTPELKLVTERAVVLTIGQTPEFLPGWERAGP